MRRARLLLSLVLPSLAAGAKPARVQPTGGTPTGQVVEFHFERPGAVVAAYSITLNAEGEGSYIAGAAQAGSGLPGELNHGPRPLHAGPAVLARILAARGSVGPQPCETRIKHIANTGQKRLSFHGGEGEPVSCTFNYSDTALLNEVASTFIALAETVQAGERLAAKHRFDRLGLDPEMEGLDTEVKAGRALEVGNIAPVLRSIAEDGRVIDRVRRRAARLLQDSGSLPAEAAGTFVPAPSER